MSQQIPTDKEAEVYASHFVINGDMCAAFQVTFPDSNATIASKYTKASKLHKHIKIQSSIANARATVREVAKEKLKIDAAWVLEQAVKVHARCMQEEEVLVKGIPSGEFRFEAAGANKSLELIGKHIDVQAFSDTLNIKATAETTPWSEIKASVDEKD